MVTRAPLLVTAILAAGLGCTACTQTQANVARICGALEIAEVTDAGAPGARLLHKTDGEAISVVRAPLVTTNDVADARPAMAEGHQVLEIDLNAAPAAALQTFTASHVGARLAFVVNGRVRNVARILDPIAGRGLIVDPVSAPEAAAIAQCVHARRDAGAGL